MRLTVNGDPVGFTLESERLLGEVVAGVERWLGQQGFLASTMAADGVALSPATRPQWHERPIDAVGELAVGALPRAELDAEIARRLAAVQPLVGRLAEVPVQLATGRDGEAMATVRDLSDGVGALLPLVPLLPPDPRHEQLFAELNGVLHDLADALAARDTVLTGDLAEYEVAPRVERLVEALGGHPSPSDSPVGEAAPGGHP